MYIEPTLTCGARGCDKLALQVTHALNTQFNRKVVTICGSDLVAESVVPFITTSMVSFPKGGIFRPLPPEEEASPRQCMERTLVLRSFPWLQRAGLIYCISSKGADEAEGIFLGTRFKEMMAELRNICAAPTPYGRAPWAEMTD